MAQFLLKRSDIPDKRPDPATMLTGELDLNYDEVTGGVYYKNTSGTLSKVGAAQLSSTEPNSTPAGSAGNALGELWFDQSVAILKVFDGFGWSNPIGYATPNQLGLIFGCTRCGSVGIGVNALCSYNVSLGGSVTAIGENASRFLLSSSTRTVAIGREALFYATNVCDTIAIGTGAAYGLTTNGGNIAIGSYAMCNSTSGVDNIALGANTLKNSCGSRNVAIGVCAGATQTAGNNNVIIGNALTLPSLTGSCQLAIGYCGNNYWLTGDSNKHIQPGAGIRDCTGALGTAGQVLSTTGSALVWCNNAVPAYCRALVNCGTGPTGANCLTFCGVSYGMWGAPGGYSFVFCAPSNTYWGWTTCAQNAQLNSCVFCGCSGYIAVSGWKYFNEGLSLATNSATQSATLIQYPNNTFSPPTAIFCFLGVVGSGYCNNMICVTRIF
jgi:hypothetical protein